MTEVVINACFGGFSLSHEGTMAYGKRKGLTLYPEPSEVDLKQGRSIEDAMIVHYFKVPPEQYHALENEIKESGENWKRLNNKDWYFSCRDVPRDDPDLVAVVRELGKRAGGKFAKLEIVDIPDDAEWEIAEYDGNEHVAEKHRTWS